MKSLTEIKNHKIAYDGSDGQLIIPFNFNALKQLVPWWDDKEIPWLKNRLHNWNHAFGIIDWFSNGDFKVEIIEIINGRTTLWGKQING